MTAPDADAVDALSFSGQGPSVIGPIDLVGGEKHDLGGPGGDQGGVEPERLGGPADRGGQRTDAGRSSTGTRRPSIRLEPQHQRTTGLTGGRMVRGEVLGSDRVINQTMRRSRIASSSFRSLR